MEDSDVPQVIVEEGTRKRLIQEGRDSFEELERV